MRSALLAVGAAGLLLGAAGAALAQPAKPEPAKAEPAKAEASKPDANKPEATKPESAEAAAAAAAMERAQRMAANPMRVIMQASKIRRRPETEAAAEPLRTNLRPVSASVAAPAAIARAAPVQAAAGTSAKAASTTTPPAAAASPAAVQTDAARTDAVVEEPPAPVAALAPVVAAAPEPVLEPALQPAALTLTQTPLPTRPVGALSTAVSDAPAISAVAPAATAAALGIRPKLMTMIEPEIPPRLLSDSPRAVEIFADLALRPDGTVGSVTLLPGVPRAWQRYVTAALERWRFEPLPAGRVHRVQLIFGE